MCVQLTHHFRFVFTSVSGEFLNIRYIYIDIVSLQLIEKKSKIKRSKGGLEPLFNEKSIGLKPTLQTPEAHRCPFIIISQWIYICNTICMLLGIVNFMYI